MSGKYEHITGIYNDQIQKVTASFEDWKAFLKTASNNYKYNFGEQLLIYAQKPEATACAEIGFWNEKMQRWVNKGASGIALFDYASGRQRLRYVFDVSDTNSFYGYEVPRWEVKERYHSEICEALSNAFGEVAEGGLESVIDDTARNLVEDNALDYISVLEEVKNGSFLEELDSDNISVIFKDALSSSIGYMMMKRCGLDADSFYDFEDFKAIFNFNTHEVVVQLGNALSDISEMGIREIESTVKNLQKNEKKRNRTFVKEKEIDYDEGAKEKEITERSNENDTDSVQTGRRLQNPEHQTSEGGERYSWQVRYDENEILAEEQVGNVYASDNQGHIDENPQEDRGRSERDAGTPDRTDDENSGRNGTAQGEQSDALGADDEQHPSLSRRDSSQGTDLQLKF